MNNYIVDASVVIQHLLSEPYTVNADAFFGNVGKTIQAYVPEFCLLECTNVLWKHVRFQGMPQNQAEQLVEDLMVLPLSIVSVRNFLKRGL